MLILRSLKFTCLKLSLYVLGKYGNCVNKTCGGLKKLYLNPSEEYSHSNHLILHRGEVLPKVFGWFQLEP